MPECNGLCMTAADIGVGRADQIAYPHPLCPLHASGQPDRLLSPTHDGASAAPRTTANLTTTEETRTDG